VTIEEAVDVIAKMEIREKMDDVAVDASSASEIREVLRDKYPEVYAVIHCKTNGCFLFWRYL
jgi:hypothetical protein